MTTTATTLQTRHPALGFVTLGLILVQCATVWYFTGSDFFPAGVVLLTAWLVFRDTRFEISRGTRIRLGIGLAVLFLVKARVAPIHIRSGSMTSLTQVAHVAGQYLMLLQLMLLGTRRRVDRYPHLFPWLGALGLICAGDVFVSPVQRSVFQLATLCYVLLAAAFSSLNRDIISTQIRRSRSGRSAGIGALLATTAVFGWWAAQSLYRHERDLEKLIARLVDPAVQDQVGFSGQGQLDSVVNLRERSSDAIAMRVYSTQSPGYLRGHFFSEFSGRKWRSANNTRHVSPTQVAPTDEATDYENVFSVAIGPDTTSSGEVEIWAELDSRGTIFTPGKATFVGAAVPSIQISADDNIAAPDLPSGYSYRVLTSHNLVESLTPDERRRFLQLPDGRARAAVDELAATLFDSGQTTREKIDIIRDHFHKHHKYATRLKVPSGKHPLSWFIRQRGAAHCEYFASATAAVLRAGGVPTRYVTGFVTPERNAFGGYWVVRNRYAHAWAQAWDPEHGWIDVDATPAGGIPTAEAPPGRFAQFWQYLRDRIQVARVRFHQRGFMWFVARAVLWRPLQIAVGLIVAWLIVRQLRGRSAKRGARTKPDPRVQAFRRLLKGVDTTLKRRHGLIRAPAETLHQFARRIEQETALANGGQISEWYRHYAAARYRPTAVETPDDVSQLEAAARQLWARSAA